MPLYANMLPTAVPLLRDWSESELSHLQCDELRSMIQSQEENLSNSCARVGAAAARRGLGTLSPATIEWSESIVRSRGLAVASDASGRRCMVLAPLFDLCNHAHSTNGYSTNSDDSSDDLSDDEAEQVFISSDGMIVLCARWSLRANDEVTIQYGAEGNAGLLLNYGFAVDEEQCQPEPILLRCDQSTVVAPCGGGVKLGSNIGQHGAESSDGSRELLTLGSDESDKAAVNSVRRSLSWDAEPSGGKSATSEDRAVVAVLLRACREKLERMPTSEQEDAAEFASLQGSRLQGALGVDFRWLSALHYRLGQKRRLRRLAEQLTALGPVFDAADGHSDGASPSADALESPTHLRVLDAMRRARRGSEVDSKLLG